MALVNILMVHLLTVKVARKRGIQHNIEIYRLSS